MPIETELPQPSRLPRWAHLVAASSLAILVALVFYPILGFEFVDLDVPEHVIENEWVHDLSLDNIGHILTSRCGKSYYPIRTLTFAVDYWCWGANPMGFKLTNGLIHLANVLLVFWLIHRLFWRGERGTSSGTWWDAFAAAFGAGIFAVHPLVVEPVAWVSGREELLMTLGALGAIHFHLTARRLEARGARASSTLAYHAGTILCCAAACLSNAVAAVTPLLITTWDILMLDRPKLRRTLTTAGPLWGVAIVTIVIKKLGEVGSTSGAPAMFSQTWGMLILKIFWLNIKAVLWPAELAVHYAWPQPGSLLDPEVMLGGTALGAVCLVLWILWRRKRCLLLFGLCWFGLALGPTAAILPHHLCRADRFLYLPLAGLVIAVAAGLRALDASHNRHMARGAAVAGSLLLLGAAWLSGRQLPVWHDSVSVWENALRVNPDNAFAHSCLARSLAARQQFKRSIVHYEAALELPPVQAQTLADFGWLLATCDDGGLRNYGRAVQLAEWACTATQWQDRETLQKYAKVHCGFAEHLAAQGKVEDAARHYAISIDADPEFDVPLFNLALLLATSADDRFRRPDLAVELAERGCRLAANPDAQRLGVLALAYSEAKRFDDAVTVIQRAIQLAGSSGDSLLAEKFRSQSELYRRQAVSAGPSN